MTDYVAFNKENKPYSIHDIEKILKDILNYKPDLYCICKEPVFYNKKIVQSLKINTDKNTKDKPLQPLS